MGQKSILLWLIQEINDIWQAQRVVSTDQNVSVDEASVELGGDWLEELLNDIQWYILQKPDFNKLSRLWKKN